MGRRVPAFVADASFETIALRMKAMARTLALWHGFSAALTLGVAGTLVLVWPTQPGRGEEPVGQTQSAGLPRIGCTDTVLTFQALRFAPIPPSQTTAIINNYDAGVLQWDMASNRSWLSASPNAALANSTDVAIWIVNTDAELGQHVGHLIIESENAVNSPDTVWVQLNMLCPVQVLGDANWDGRLSQADIIYLVNHILRAGPPPRPVWQAGDMNCDEAVTQSDIIAVVHHLLRGGPPPCNVCQFF